MTIRQRGWALTAIGGLLLPLTGIGLYEQQHGAHDALAAIILIEGALYLVAAQLVWPGGFSRRMLIGVLAVAAVMRVAVLTAPPSLSTDIYRYIWDGRVQAAGNNPYRYVPVDPHLAALRDGVIFPNVNRSTYARTIYPPLAEATFFAVTRISERVTWMKTAMVLIEAAGIALLIRLLFLKALPPERILLYAWHPLTVWEFAGSGHIDAALVALVALALWAHARKAVAFTGIALGCAALVKFLPIVILPALYRRWDWKLPAAALATVAVGYLPYLSAGPAVFGFLHGYVAEEGLASGRGIYLWSLLRAAVPSLGASDWPYLVVAGGALAALALYVVLARQDDHDDITRAAVLAFAFLALLSPHYPWYFCWAITFLCFVPWGSLRYLSVASALLYFVKGGPDLTGPWLLVESAMYGPFVVIALLELRRPRVRSISAEAQQ
ncbi:MAG: glycosyltransferase 87 family protein [Stellaceae bacterium]